ncbi:hypothetical protein [Brucella anthropi]|uniref:hypothetical protein n=1 Tax=Brucella anthropi TaxID=529 RepID=UPI0005699FDF|nr:hypothetical protein [Brucella anthropi]
MKQDNVIDTIEKLLAENTEASLTYAALECRLAIERICYERLRIAHDYISHDEIKKWQPKEVIRIIADEVNEDVKNDFFLQISTAPMPSAVKNPTVEDFAKLDYVPVGNHVGLNSAKLGKLWNALSGLALHTPLPKCKEDEVSYYGDSAKIREKVLEALHEIKRIYSGSLITSGLGEEVSFDCVCGAKVRRRLGLLSNGKVIFCTEADCKESYIFNADGGLARRIFHAECRHCSQSTPIHQRLIDGMQRNDTLQFQCQNAVCAEKLIFRCIVAVGQSSRTPDEKQT